MSFSKDEIRLLLFWRERCNNLGAKQECNTCPLYSLSTGTIFCHKLTKKLEALFQEELKKEAKQ